MRPTRGEQVLAAGALLASVVLGLISSVARDLVGSPETAASVPAGSLPIVFLAVACALFRSNWQPGRRLGWILILATIAGAIGFVLRRLFASSIPWDPERALALLGSDGPWLRLSFPSAMGLVVTAGVVALSATSQNHPGHWRRSGLLVSLAMGALSGLLAISRAAGMPMFTMDDAVAGFWGPLALALVHSALALGFGLWPETEALVRGQPLPGSGLPSKERGGRWLLLGLVGLPVLLLAVTFVFLRSRVEERQVELQDDFSDLLQSKAAQIEAWREERLGDASVIMRVPQLADNIAALGRNPRSATADFSLRELLIEYQRTFGYDSVSVLDARGVPLWSSPAGAVNVTLPSSAVRAGLPQARKAILDDLQLGPAGELWLDVLAPIRAPGDQELVGAVCLRIDARRHILSLVEEKLARWQSGELFLVRREGDQIVFLSQLRFRSDAALKFRLSSANSDLLSAQALQGGLATLGAGHDYRNVRVLGMARPVAGSTWMMIGKIDHTEAYAPVRAAAWSIGIAFTGFMFGGGMVARGFWRRRQLQHARQSWAAEQARHAAMERLGLVMKHANDIILLFDEQMRIVEANQRAEEAYGYSAEELRQRTALDLRSPSAHSQLAGDFSRAVREGGLFVRTHRHRDGREFPVEVSARPIAVEGRSHVLAIIRDISERQANEREIERLSRMYQVISRVNQTLVRAKNRRDLLHEVCRAMVESRLLKIAWAGWREPSSSQLVPLTVAGDEHGCTGGLRVDLEGEDPESFGPAGQAFREGRAVVENDLRAVLPAPLRERAERSGLNALLALPIKEGGAPMGVLVVFAAEKNFFQPAEIALLEEAVGDVSFALDLFAREALARQTAASLAASEHQLQFLLSSTPVVIFTYRPEDLTVTFVSDNVARITGYAASEFLQSPSFWIEHVHPEDRAAAVADLSVAGPGESAVCEYRFLFADGTYRWMRDQVSEAPAIPGRPREYVGFWLEVTARREAERALHEREQLISTVFDQALDSIILYDLKDDRFAEFNLSAHRNLGYTREEFARLTIRDIDVGLTPAQVASAIQLFSSPGGGVVDTRHRRKDGTTIEVRLGARKVSIGDRDYLVTMWSDVTERRKMEEALRASEERHRALFENMDLGVVYQDATGAITAANSAAASILGLSLDQLQGRTSMDPAWRALREDGSVFPGEEHPAPMALRTGSRIHGVVMGVRSGSRPETRWLLVDAVPEFRPGESKPHRVFAIFNDITVRRRAEAEVRKLSTAVEQSPSAVIITDLSGRIEYVNARFTALSGYTAAEAIGENSRFLKSGRTAAETYTRLWQTILAGGVWRGELVNRKKSGELFIAHALITPVRDAAGQVTHYLGLQEDVTERKRAEAELLETAAGLKILHDVAVALELSELSPSVLGDAVAAELPSLTGAPADWQAVVEIDGHRQVGGAAGERLEETSSAISINGRPAGHITLGYVRRPSAGAEASLGAREAGLVESIARTIGLGLGRREAYAQVQRFNADLEAKVAQRTAELAARAREIEGLLASIPDMVLRVNRAGELLDCQSARGATRLAGLECRAPCLITALPSPLHAAVLVTGRQALEQQSTAFAETIIDVDGAGAINVEVRAAPVGPNDFVAFVRDITDRKRAEAEAAGLLEKERQVSEMKSRFISVTSHEFRTPIAAALGTLELLRGHLDRIAPPKREEMFARITSSLQRMTEMLEDLLQLNRIDAGRTKVELAPVNLRNFLQDVVDEARLADRSAHEFTFTWAGEDTEVMTDLHLLHHIFSNLLSNAARYSPVGTVIAARGRVEPDGVWLVVEDRGIGVPEVDRDRIFEPFERGSNVGTIKGTGLGLSIVKRMTELLGGTIRFEPAAAGGSCFILVLPRRLG